jgi:hypothetical protein
MMIQATRATRHARDRARRRRISAASIADTLQRPIEQRTRGSLTQVIGKTCTVVIDRGVIITVY